jgi:hypothetical protein
MTAASLSIYSHQTSGNTGTTFIIGFYGEISLFCGKKRHFPCLKSDLFMC